MAAAGPRIDAPIIITGSRIPRTNLTAVSPVSVVSNKEVKLQGTTNVGDSTHGGVAMVKVATQRGI